MSDLNPENPLPERLPHRTWLLHGREITSNGDPINNYADLLNGCEQRERPSLQRVLASLCVCVRARARACVCVCVCVRVFFVLLGVAPLSVVSGGYTGNQDECAGVRPLFETIARMTTTSPGHGAHQWEFHWPLVPKCSA